MISHLIVPPSTQVVEGRLNKFYEDSCLLEQRYLLDDSVKVKGAIDR